MDLIVRAVDVGCGNTKVVTAVSGSDIRCAVFPSVAHPCSSDAAERMAGERRKTVCIPIGPLFYEVGAEVSRAADIVRSTQLHDESMKSPEYIALLRGSTRHDEGAAHRSADRGTAGGVVQPEEAGT